MAQSNKPPTLTQANHVYLYRLLAGTIGCGRQTFITQVEEALASDRMTAEDLGFESTRDLLEELEDFVTLTVFKGGRIYATITAQPEWDEALEQQAKADAGGTQASARARRHGRTKTVRAVKPRRVKREQEPSTEPEGAEREVSSSNEEERPNGNADSPKEAEAADPEAPGEKPTPTETAAGSPASDAGEMPTDEGDAEALAPSGTDGPKNPGRDNVSADEGTTASEKSEPEDNLASTHDEPSITFTVTYNPYAGMQPEEVEDTLPGHEPEHEPAPAGPSKPRSAREQSRRTDGHAPAREARRSTPAPEPTAASPDTPPSQEALASYPHDFATEAYLPQALGGILSTVLPFERTATDVLTQGLETARNEGTLIGNRSQARFSFKLPESDLSCTVLIRKRAGGELAWTVSSVEFSID